MKKLMIAVLLMASATQAQAFTAERCAALEQSAAYAYITETYCVVEVAGLADDIRDKIDNSNCATFPKAQRDLWVEASVKVVTNIIKRDGLKASCNDFVYGYNKFVADKY